MRYTHNQPGGKVNCSISWIVIINDAPRNGRVLRRVEYIEDEDAQDIDDQDTH